MGINSVSHSLQSVQPTSDQRTSLVNNLSKSKPSETAPSPFWTTGKTAVAVLSLFGLSAFIYLLKRADATVDPNPKDSIVNEVDLLPIKPVIHRLFQNTCPVPGTSAKLDMTSWIEIGPCTLKYASGDIYKGECLSGRIRHGQGTYFRQNGGQDIGKWQYGKMNGHCTMKYQRGDTYTGECRDGLRHGTGTYIFPDGEQHIGEWQYNKMNGQCILKYSNGNTYEGQCRNDYRHGNGTLTFTDGKQWVGEWENDSFHKTENVTQSD